MQRPSGLRGWGSAALAFDSTKGFPGKLVALDRDEYVIDVAGEGPTEAKKAKTIDSYFSQPKPTCAMGQARTSTAPPVRSPQPEQTIVTPATAQATIPDPVGDVAQAETIIRSQSGLYIAEYAAKLGKWGQGD